MKLPSPEMLAQLKMQRLNPDAPAAAAVFSLPVPPGSGEVNVGGSHSQSVPIAWWPEWMLGGEANPAERTYPSAYPDGDEPRRRLVTISAEGELPAEVQVSADATGGEYVGPQWEARIIESNYVTAINWEVGELVLRHEGKELGLRLGLLTDADGPMWWEWLRVEELWSGPACRAIRACGYASAFRLTSEHPDVKDVRCPKWTHQQHWVLCEAYILLFANGVVHVTARHVNNHLYDGGRDINGVVPVIGLRGDFAEDMPLLGETVETSVGGVRLSTEECRTLASERWPGRLWASDGLALLRAYEGVEVPLAGFGYSGEGQGYVVRADEHRLPVGVGRTVRFCLSFGDAPARVERYAVPYYWYGLCGELVPDSLLPVSDFRDTTIDAAGYWLEDRQLIGHFCDGSLPRGDSHYRGEQIAEGGWEGETPYNLIRYFYRRPAHHTWEACLRDVYQIADVIVDHATFNFRMHGYDFEAISPTMNRTPGLLQGYLETGDPYLRETAENVALNSFTMDTSNWPRRAYGRDAMYIRALVMLDDYLPGRGYGVRAREAIGRAIACQRADGSYSDQAGPGGLHAAGNMVIKPWMNLMVMEPMLDWLERHPEDREVEQTAKRICDWLLAQFIRKDGEAYWPYESAWGENIGNPSNPESRHPWLKWTLGYPARPMLWATMRFGDPRFLQAWEDTFRWQGGYDPERAAKVPLGGDHHANKYAEWLTWHQIRRWQVRWEDGEARATPCLLAGEDCAAEAYTPEGMVGLRA
jgi:hypothetical protein